jgi:ribose 5-phosphate isomerase B
MKIAIGNDHIGLELKDKLDSYFDKKKIEVVHFGTFTTERMNYPEIAFKLAEALARGEFSSGVLICGTGVGMSLAANQVDGVRSVVCSEPYSAKMAREHNDANMICFGSRVIGCEMAKLILDNWFESLYLEGRHQGRVEMINNYKSGQKL